MKLFDFVDSYEEAVNIKLDPFQSPNTIQYNSIQFNSINYISFPCPFLPISSIPAPIIKSQFLPFLYNNIPPSFPSPTTMELMALIQQLNQGKHLANQLRTHLHPSSSSHAIHLIDQILRSYDNALVSLAPAAALKSTPVPTKKR